MGSRLFIKFYSLIVLVILLLGAGVYALTVPFIEESVYGIEAANARQALDKVYNVVHDLDQQTRRLRETATESRKRELRHLVEVGESFLRGRLAALEAAGTPSAEARSLALEELRGFSYGQKDYFWAVDYDGWMLSHPDPKLQHTSVAEVRDIHGDRFVPNMVAIARRDGEGFYSYWWRRLGAEEPSEKISFFRDHPEWGMVLFSGVYLDDIEADMRTLDAALIEDMRRHLHRITNAKTGYLFIFNAQFQMIAHPNPNIEGIVASDLKNPLTDQPLLQELIEAAESSEGMHYQWDKLSDPDHYVHDKIAWIRYYPERQWYIGSSVYTEELLRSSEVLARRILLIALTTLILSLGLGYLFARFLTHPILDLVNTAKRIAGGDLSATSPIRRNDEIGALAAAFNGMVSQLRDHIENRDVQVAERTAELRKAYEDLQQLDRMKSDFLSSISHELRTPLTAIQGFVRLAGRDLGRLASTGGEAKAAQKLERVRNNLVVVDQEAQRMERLVEDIIEIALIESQEAEWSDGWVDILVVLESVRAAAPLAARPEIDLEWVVPPELPQVVADLRRLESVLLRLLDNLAKFALAGPARLEVVAIEGMVRFSLEDSGPGIAPEHRERIFDRFYQIMPTDRGALVDKPPGTGLGLALCRGIVAHYGGRIWVEPSTGGGSIFRFTLPAGPADHS